MKTASVQHLSTLVNNREYTSYHIELNWLTNAGSSIMKKLTNVSPFLLLLVPVFMMIAFTVALKYI